MIVCQEYAYTIIAFLFEIVIRMLLLRSLYIHCNVTTLPGCYIWHMSTLSLPFPCCFCHKNYTSSFREKNATVILLTDDIMTGIAKRGKFFRQADPGEENKLQRTYTMYQCLLL